MKKNVKNIIVAGALMVSIFSGCANNNGVSPVNDSPGNSAQELSSQSPMEKAIGMAKKFLSSQCVMETDAQWAKSAVVTNAFPVYLDGVQDVSYFECKIQNNGSDAGYILVNINQTDIPVSQYSTDGMAPSEKLAADAGYSVSDLQVYRQNCYTMFAEKKSSSALGKRTVLIQQGPDCGGLAKKKATNDEAFNAKRLAFIERVQKAGGVNPHYSKDQLMRIYNRENLVADSMKNHPGELAKTTYSDRWTSDELNNTFLTGWHLPHWNQPRNASNQLSGCGPTALAMLYAYHRQFNGKTSLFGGLDLNSYVLLPGSTTTYVSANSSSGTGYWAIANVMFQIGADCGVDYGSDETSADWNQLENEGERYGDNLGYNVVLDMDFGGDFTKGKTALGHIRAERPCMVRFADDVNGDDDHAGAIEGVKYQERKYIWNWYDREMWYLVNYGWGYKRDWICVDAQYGSDATEYKNTGNLYMWIN
jgi:hypothetical protein